MAIEIFQSSKRVGACVMILGKCFFFILHFPSWVTKDFLLPSDGVGVFNGDQNSLVTIQHTFTV
jgi:hypothetical protein